MNIVSITSTSYRLRYMEPTLKSIREGEVQPDVLMLTLSKQKAPAPLQDAGIIRGIDLPLFLKKYDVIVYFEEKNYGPLCKLTQALFLHQYTNNTIVCADDDIIYPSDWLSKILYFQNVYPGCLITYRARTVLTDEDGNLKPYGIWPRTNAKVTDFRRILPTGCQGMLVKPFFFNKDFYNYDKFLKTCLTNDDIWVYLHLRVPVAIMPESKAEQNPKIKDLFALEQINRLGMGLNDVILSAFEPQIKEILNRNTRVPLLYHNPLTFL